MDSLYANEQYKVYTENKFIILAANILSTFTQIVMLGSNDNVSGTSLGQAVRGQDMFPRI